MSAILDELKWRGLIADCTDLAALGKRLDQGPITLYCGFDPTADSLQVGNLVPLLTLRRFQMMGHHPIALAGGATGMIGDPGGRKTERELKTREQVHANIELIKGQLKRLLDFDTTKNPARLVDNADWTTPLSFIDFLRDVGKFFTVNYMVNKEFIKSRMEDAANGISFTEFCYMLLQANDFHHLRATMNCELQVAGTDQWGNITAGVELCRKKAETTVFGLVFPLVTKADGTKFGKSAEGAVWLDPNKTKVEDFYQFWMQADDSKVIDYLKVFTFLSREQIEDLAHQLKEKPQERAAQKALADEVTKLVHGDQLLQKARPAEGENIFTISAERLRELSREELEKILVGIPEWRVTLANLREGSLHALPSLEKLVEYLEQCKLVKSKSDARRTSEAGGISVNKFVEKDIERNLTTNDFLPGNIIILGRGKRNFVVCRFFY